MLFFCFFVISAHLSAFSFNPFSPDVPTTSVPNGNEQVSVSSDNIFKIINPIPTTSLSEDAGLNVRLYSQTNKFLYAHSTLAFAPLKHLYSGDQIYLEQNQAGDYYQIQERLVFSKSELNANSARRSAIYHAQYNGKTYDYALMTCGDGTNDDEDFRLVLFVSKV